MVPTDDLRAAARRCGFELAGVAPVEPVGGGWFAPHAARLNAWLAAGHAADMAWIAERAGERVVPERLLPRVQSAIVLWLPHRTPPLARPPGAHGRVASYAWGRDYHNVARKMLRKLRRWLSEQLPTARMYLSIDTGPVLERAFGERAGVGWIGKSAMLIHPRFGTFGSLAVVFIDAALPGAADPHPDRCGTCSACIDGCPTGAIVAPGMVDARRCISYWTIEHRGLIPVEVRPTLGEWVFGCDICQDVCPWNRDAPHADAARWAPDPARAWPDLVAWIAADTAALAASLHGSPLQRAGAAGLRRNAMIAAANGGHVIALPALRAVVAADPDPVLQTTAAWAVAVLAPSPLPLEPAMR